MIIAVESLHAATQEKKALHAATQEKNAQHAATQEKRRSMLRPMKKGAACCASTVNILTICR